MSFWLTQENTCTCKRKSKFRGYRREMSYSGDNYFADCSTCGEEIRVPFQALWGPPHGDILKNVVELRTESVSVSHKCIVGHR